MKGALVLLIIFKDPICSPLEIKCVNSVKVNTSNCLKPCSGLIITTLSKTEQNRDLETLFPIFNDYDNYKMITMYPDGQPGNHLNDCIKTFLNMK